MMKSDDEVGTSYDKVKVSSGNEILNGFPQPCGTKIIQEHKYWRDTEQTSRIEEVKLTG